jgi:hypothetical protein
MEWAKGAMSHANLVAKLVYKLESRPRAMAVPISGTTQGTRAAPDSDGFQIAVGKLRAAFEN